LISDSGTAWAFGSPTGGAPPADGDAPAAPTTGSTACGCALGDGVEAAVEPPQPASAAPPSNAASAAPTHEGISRRRPEHRERRAFDCGGGVAVEIVVAGREERRRQWPAQPSLALEPRCHGREHGERHLPEVAE